MSVLTNWGYSITEADTIPNMMDYDEYATFTGREDNPDRVEAELFAACASIRNYVGWHLYPSESCRLEMLAVTAG